MPKSLYFGIWRPAFGINLLHHAMSASRCVMRSLSASLSRPSVCSGFPELTRSAASRCLTVRRGRRRSYVYGTRTGRWHLRVVSSTLHCSRSVGSTRAGHQRPSTVRNASTVSLSVSKFSGGGPKSLNRFHCCTKREPCSQFGFKSSGKTHTHTSSDSRIRKARRAQDLTRKRFGN